MSAPDAPTISTPPPEALAWTEEDINAALQSAYWFDSSATEEMIAPYSGMHIAIFGERIIDADRDRTELCRRLDAKSDEFPASRLILRYIPTDEEARLFRY